MKKIKNLIVIAFAVLVSAFVVACQPTGPDAQEIVTEAAKKISISGDLQAVTADLDLKSSLSFDYEGETYSIALTWESKNTAVLAHDGKVTQGASDTDVELVATATYEGKTATKTFDIKVLAIPVDTDKLIAESAAKAVTISGITLDEVTEDFTLPVSLSHSYEGTAYTVALSWASNKSNIAVSGANATVTRPEFGQGNVKVELTVTATYEGKTGTHKLELTVLEKEDERPVVTGEVYHWMIGARLANVTASLDLKGADESSLKVFYGTEELVLMDDFDYNDGDFSIMGLYLETIVTENKTYTFKVETSLGTTNFDVIVVDDPRGTSIPMETKTIVNMIDVEESTPSTVIANAPDLLITEIATDAGVNSYIEIFNNTNAPYNLKNHRIVFADTSKQRLFATDGIFQEPYGMAGGAFIYQDYIIPALTKAYIWVVSAYPWEVANGVLTQTANTDHMIFGTGENNLSVAKFKDLYDLGESDLVFPVRPQYILMNNTSSYNETTNYGIGVAKASGSRWGGVNSSIANRSVQIQKYNLDKQVLVENLTNAPASLPTGATYVKYEVDVLNREEDVYVNGVLDKTKIVLYGKDSASGTASATARETVNAFSARRVFYNATNEVVGYQGIDQYNAPAANSLGDSLCKDIVTPLATALFYPRLDENNAATKWGPGYSMEYTIPAAGTTVARFIARENPHRYDILYAEDALKTLKLAGISTVFVDDVLFKEVSVPISAAYPVNYVKSNSVGVTGWFNFTTVKPS